LELVDHFVVDVVFLLKFNLGFGEKDFQNILSIERKLNFLVVL